MNRRIESCAALLVLVMSATLAMSACGGRVDEADGGSAGSNPTVVSEAACKKACPNDPDPAASAVETCKSGKDPSGTGCDAQYVAVLNCAAGLVVCKDGKTDATASANAVFAKCSSVFLGYQACLLKGFEGGIPKGFDAGR